MRAPRDPPGPAWTMAGTEVVEDTGPATAKVDLEFTSPSEANIGGAFLGIDLPASVFSSGSVELIEPTPPPPERTPPALTGKTTAGQAAKKSFSFKVTGEIDRNPVEITLDASHPGQLFDGLGGNFRLQNARTDPQVIDYSLENIRVAWGRVEMPWSIWQPDETADPLAAARAGNVNPRVQQAMEMARRLAQKGMPVIVSAWQAPMWAVLSAGGGRGNPGGAPRGGTPQAPQRSPLNPEKMARIKDSIAGYLLFLKEKYGVEAAMFSFNESDIGINVLQTAREHEELIKTLGAWFASKGLATKLALGDTSDANPINFIQPAMHDPEAVKYIGAVDFHSWRGCTDELLAQWRDAN